MSHAPDREFLETSLLNMEELLGRYSVLLELYSELESVSDVVFQALENGSPARNIQGYLNIKMQLAEKIVRESRLIAGIKKALSEENACGEIERRRVRQWEDRLTLAVNRIIDQENRCRDLVMRQGMKIERR